MASKTCTQCLRAMRRQSRSIVKSNPPYSYRTFTTSTSLFRTIPDGTTTDPASIPPVTPTRAEGGGYDPKSSTAASILSALGGRSTDTYRAYGMTEQLYKECAAMADYTIPQAGTEEEIPKTESGEDLGVGSGYWHEGIGLLPTFSTWSQVTMLHMYMLSVRFRMFHADDAPAWQQHLLDHFFYDAENRMAVNHNMAARGTRNKYLKDLYIQWRGVLAAYDEGLARGDAVLAAAVWRNVFKADEEVDVRKLGAIVSYMRRVLKGLDSIPDRTVAQGKIAFGSPSTEGPVVSERSKLMDAPFEVMKNAPAARKA